MNFMNTANTSLDMQKVLLSLQVFSMKTVNVKTINIKDENESSSAAGRRQYFISEL